MSIRQCVRAVSGTFVIALLLLAHRGGSAEFINGLSIGAGAMPTAFCATSPLCPGRFHDLMPMERSHGAGGGLLNERTEYWATDSAAQFFFNYGNIASRRGVPQLEGKQVRLELFSGSTLLNTLLVTELKGVKLEVIIDLPQLRPGDYSLRAKVEDSGTSLELFSAEKAFRKTQKRDATGNFPADGISINVHEIKTAENGQWPITTGIPFPRGALRNADQLVLLENGKRIPAQFIVRGTHGLNGDIRWLGLDFLARYDKGVPRKYVLALDKAPATLDPALPKVSVESSADYMVLSTGVAQFKISKRRFAGIEQAWLDVNGDKSFQPSEMVVNGVGGPYLVDEGGTVYESLNDAQSVVSIEESGPLRTTVAAKGWYVSQTAERLCQFVTRISVFAGMPYALINHRTIISYDTRTSKRLADVAWNFRLMGAGSEYLFGGDGKAHRGSFPSKGSLVYLHQDKGSHYRLENSNGTLGEGQRSDGWVTARMGQAAASVLVRDIYQKYPKELELTNEDAGGVKAGAATTSPLGARLVAHFWPRHGREVFSEQEQLDRTNIYKLLYAHHGKFLDFNIPASYVAKLNELHATPGTPDTGWDKEGQILQAIRANAQGVSIGNEFFLHLHPRSTTEDELKMTARLAQLSPHALADPKWNAMSNYDGPWAEKDTAFFPEYERYIDLSYPRYNQYVIEQTGEQGMWINADIHNAWRPDRSVPDLHRVWQGSHYQNVWAGWFFYLRSGNPDMFQWARANSDHFRDVQTVSFDRSTTSYGLRRAGAQLHCKGFLPWAGELGSGNHWVDSTNFFLKYYLTGDRQAWDAGVTFGQSVIAGMQTIPAFAPPAPEGSCESYGGVSLRHYLPLLAEMIEYYQATWDPTALYYIAPTSSIVERYVNSPYECSVSPNIHPTIHGNWYTRYYELTRDDRVVERLKEWATNGYGTLQTNAFLYHRTKDASYLHKLIPGFYDDAHEVYVNNSDLYNGYSRMHTPAHALWMREAPYFLKAMKDAGIKPYLGQKDLRYPVATGGGIPTYILGTKSSDGRVRISFTPYDTQLVSAYSLLDLSTDMSPYFSETWRFDPVLKDVAVEQSRSLFRLKCVGYKCDTQSQLFRDSDGVSAAPEVFVLPKDIYRVSRDPALNGRAYPLAAQGRQDFYVRPVDLSQPVTLLFEGEKSGRYGAHPAFIRVEDANGQVLAEGTIFHFGQKPSLSVTLDSAKTKAPWHVRSSALEGPYMTITSGPDELLYALRPEYFDAIIPKLPPAPPYFLNSR